MAGIPPDVKPSSALRRHLLKGMAALPAAALFPRVGLAATIPAATVNTSGLAVTDDTVTCGILHSLTGTMAPSETGATEAEKLAISQINASGGVLGRQIKIVQEDGASDWPTFAEKACKLLASDHCAAVFGCWTSASRKAVLQVFEQLNGMLYYPTFYEGLEESKNVIYTGQEATQQILAGLNWIAVASGGVVFDKAPEGYVRIHDKNHHLWSRTRVGRARLGGQFDVVYETPELIEPNPFPAGYQ